MSRAVITPVAGLKLLKVGFGAMGLSTTGPLDDAQCFDVLKHALGQAGPGEKVVVNSSEHYGPQAANLKLLSRFFTKYPELSDKAYVVVKGGLGVFNEATNCQIAFDTSANGLRVSAEGVARTLKPKKVDSFGPGRLDPKVPIEEVMSTLVTLQKEGLFENIGLSEISGSTLRKAFAIAPVVSVETEVSPMAWEDQTKNILAAAEETKTAIIAYSPMGRGALSGKAFEEIDSHVRELFPRFSKENWEHNKLLGDKMKALADKKGVSVGQLSLAWVKGTSAQVIPIPGTTKISRVTENFKTLDIQLTPQENEEITRLAETTEVKGDRYPKAYQHLTWA